MLLALPPELTRRALEFLPWYESKPECVARNQAFMLSIGLGDSVAALGQGTYRMRLRAVCFACLELGEARRKRYVPWDPSACVWCVSRVIATGVICQGDGVGL